MKEDATSPPAAGSSDPEPAPAEIEDEEQASIRQLLRGTFPVEEAMPDDMLQGVQRKLRQRSRGKFYGEGWSTARQPPVGTYLVTSLVMLAVVFVVWAVLSPISGEPMTVEAPQPVNVIPPP